MSSEKLAVVEEIVEAAAKAGLFEKARGKLRTPAAKWVGVITALLAAAAPLIAAYAASGAEVVRLDGRIDKIEAKLDTLPQDTGDAMVKRLIEMGLLKAPKAKK